MADLAQVIAGTGSAEYIDPVRFFAYTYFDKKLGSAPCADGASYFLTKTRMRLGINDARNPTAHVADDIGA